MKTILKKRISAMLLLSLIAFGSCNSQAKENKAAANSSKTEITTDIHTAAYLGNLDEIKKHLKAGTDLNSTEPMGGSTPLISATVFGHNEVAIELIKAGADVNVQNKEGSTALHSAAFFCRTEIVKALLQHGAKKDIINKGGSTAAQSVADDFEKVKGIYDFFGTQLGTLGLQLDYDFIKNERPIIAELLK
ncbi:ankyrin repeat domain-containing protein [Labilibacter marinus]|uniref:ankyrin repeat domain-containing protein n=1 Tax=Labilibacter marinus TaxID=1477105 RepID=UPI00094FB80E|nr:ankyrin repeat domain-containing protein [Labilibacter marinus]